MRTTVEISLYPIAEDYKTPILDFLARLKSYEELEIVTNATSTQIVGEHERIFQILAKETALTFAEVGLAIFVLKVVGMELEIQKKY